MRAGARPTGRKPIDHRDHVMSIAVAWRTRLTASRFGPRAVRNIELVTAVDANAVHIR